MQGALHESEMGAIAVTAADPVLRHRCMAQPCTEHNQAVAGARAVCWDGGSVSDSCVTGLA